METLRTYLATLTPDEQRSYAERSGTTIGYLRKALSTKPNLDGGLVRLLWDHSSGAVSRHEIRPDIWTRPEDDIWPEKLPQQEAA